MKKLDWVSIFAIVLMLASVNVAIIIYYNELRAECINDPLAYASKVYTNNYGYEFVGSGYFIMNQSSPIIVTFNSTGTNIESIRIIPQLFFSPDFPPPINKS